MATNYPASADDASTLPDPTVASYTNNPSHFGLHANENAAIKAIEAKVGNGASTPPGGGFIFTSSSNGNSSWQAAPAAGVWGLITGTLSNQTDLQTALSARVQVGGDLSGTAAAPTVLTSNGIAIVTTTGTQTLTNKTFTSPVINTGKVSADPTAALGIASKQYVDNQASTSAVAINAAQVTYSASTNLVSVTLTNAPPGDYAIDINFACTPSGGGNGSISAAITGSTGTLTKKDGSIHASDADYNTTKFLQRACSAILKGHTGGTFTVNAFFNPESAVNYVFGQASDDRWATVLRVGKVG